MWGSHGGAYEECGLLRRNEVIRREPEVSEEHIASISRVKE
jgi:hypothetical protein